MNESKMNVDVKQELSDPLSTLSSSAAAATAATASTSSTAELSLYIDQALFQDPNATPTIALVNRQLEIDNEKKQIELEMAREEREFKLKMHEIQLKQTQELCDYKSQLREWVIKSVAANDTEKLAVINRCLSVGNENTLSGLAAFSNNNNQQHSILPQQHQENQHSLVNYKVKKEAKPTSLISKRIRHLITSDIFVNRNCTTLFYGYCHAKKCEYGKLKHVHSIVDSKYAINIMVRLANTVEFFKSNAIKDIVEIHDLIQKFNMIKL